MAVVMLVLLAAAGGIATVAFVLPGPLNTLGRWTDHRFSLLVNLLKLVALVAVAGALATIAAMLVLRPASTRRPVRRAAQSLAEYKDQAASVWVAWPTGPVRLFGRAVLQLTRSSVQMKDFGGKPQGIDASSLSSALAGFLPEVGSPTKIGQTAPIDPRLETAPFDATTLAQDIEQALSDAPYGKAAAALLSLADRLLPRERLFVAGNVLDSPQRGPGLTITLARSDGVVIDSEIIWSGDFDPTIVLADAQARDSVSAPLVLALAGAVWLTFAMARHTGRVKLKRTLDTESWQSYALVRVGMQGAPKRPIRITRAIYAKAVEADAEILPEGDAGNLFARYNLALAQLRGDDFKFGERYRVACRELDALKGLARQRARQADPQREPDDDPLLLSIEYNRAVALVNEHHAGRARRPLADARAELGRSLRALEERLQQLADKYKGQRNHEQAVLSQLEAPLLALWCSIDVAWRQSGQASPRPAGAALDTHDRAGLLEALADMPNLSHQQVVEEYLAGRPVDARTHYNLACYWTARKCYEQALEELAASLETGAVGKGAGADPALKKLRKAKKARFAGLMKELSLEPHPPPPLNAHRIGAPHRQAIGALRPSPRSTGTGN